MKKNIVFPTLFLSFLLVVLGLLTGCQIANQENVALAAAPESEQSYIGVNLTTLSAGDVSAYRWQAVARFYAGDPYFGVDLTTLDPDDVMAFRWLAMARVYQK